MALSEEKKNENQGNQLNRPTVAICRQVKVTVSYMFLELGICSISAILESYICFRNFYTLKK